MRDSKHWPRRALRYAYLTLLSSGAAALLVAGISQPAGWWWH
jgi:hypothetical protein